MNPLLRRIVQAYAPLRLRGMLLDGPGQWPAARRRASPEASPGARQPMPPRLAGRRASATVWSRS
ncbi:MAG: hypothetical protein KGM46_04455 [Pseudomonadota bacterium]|nr:hypothetical protein [Xanthomonadaceae bacterium]MDE2249066.1 hypothetical protein [Xanthomonadaceae bacterium]MDE3209970.1 hypothetical protein [Pseudomonadota bacterium]